MSAFKSLYEKCDGLIRGGDTHRIQPLLKKLRISRIPREWRLPFAQLCRRAGLYNLGLNLLSKYVTAEPSSRDSASQGELAEYGMLLLRLGATGEAFSILSKINTDVAPEALHYQGLMHLTKWEMPLATRSLRAYLATSPADYSAMLARSNLALALIGNREFEAARHQLDENIDQMKETGLNRLLTVNLGYRTQLHIQLEDFAAAQADIEAGERILESALTNDRMIFEKWRLVLEALAGKRVEPLDILKEQALRAWSWEDLRRADLYRLKIRFDHEQFIHLIFGTPYPGFRDVICKELREIPDRAVYRLGPKSKRQLDLQTGIVSGGSSLDPGSKTHQLVDLLLRDFYLPLRVTGIFSEICPDEHFDPKTSPDRVHAIFARARKLFVDEKIPLEIVNTNGFFSIRIHGDFSIQIPLERQSVDRMSLYFQNLKTIFSSTAEFSAAQVCEHLQVSRHTAQRIVNWGIENRLIERFGARKESKYRFIPSQLETSAVLPSRFVR